MVEEGDLDDKLEDKATNEVVDDVKKVAMEGVDKEKKQVAMKVDNTKCDLSPSRGARGPCTQCANSGLLRAHKHSRFGSYISF